MVRSCKGCKGFLIDPNDEQAHIGIYIFYPLLCFIRMVKLAFALLTYYASTGTLPYLDSSLSLIFGLVPQLLTWLLYSCGYTLLLIFTILSHIMSTLIPFSVYFFMDYDRGPATRKTLRLIQQHHDPCIISAFDTRLMILTGYCIYPWWTCFLSTPAIWYASLLKAYDKLEWQVSLPCAWLSKRIVKWPPDGIILRIILFSFLIIAQLAVISKCIYNCIRNVVSTTISNITIKTTTSHILAIKTSLWSVFASCCTQSSSSLPSTIIDTVFTSIYALSSNDLDPDKMITWDTDSSTVVVDNAANTHIWNQLDDFVVGSVRYFDDDEDVGVLTIDKDSSRPIGIGTVTLTIKTSTRKMVEMELQRCLLFPASPVKIISVTALAEHYDDEDGTWIKTCWRRSEFTWNHGAHSVEFFHPSRKLPMLQVNLGHSRLTSFCALFQELENAHQPLPLMTCQTFLPSDRFSDVCFTTDDIQSAQGDPRYRFTPRESLEKIHAVGDKLRLSHNGVNQPVDIIAVDIDESTQVPYFSVTLNDGHTIKVTKEFLTPLDEDDIASIPITPEQVSQHIDRLDAASLEALLLPPQNSELIKEFMAWHYRLGHLPIKRMLDLCKRGYLPRRFLELKDHNLTCPSCIFGKCKRKPWRTKGQPGSLRSEEENTPGAKVSIDHVISAQPGLVPRMDGRHTKDRITGACVFIDNHTRYSYTHLQTSIDGLQTLAAKHGFEQHSDACGVSIKAYHADNGIFAEQSFRNEVQSNHQKISYCAVGAHHQNGIVERHIGTLTQGARTSLLHAQRRWPEAIGTILWPFAWKDFER